MQWRSSEFTLSSVSSVHGISRLSGCCHLLPAAAAVDIAFVTVGIIPITVVIIISCKFFD